MNCLMGLCMENRTMVAAHVLQLKQKLDDSYTIGVKNLHEDISELAERYRNIAITGINTS